MLLHHVGPYIFHFSQSHLPFSPSLLTPTPLVQISAKCSTVKMSFYINKLIKTEGRKKK